MSPNTNLKLKQTTKVKNKKKKIKELKKEIQSVEKVIWNKKIPVIIFVESEDEKLKSKIIKSIISCFETITYELVLPYTKNNDIHFMVKYWRDISEKGKVKVFYNSPYNEVILSRLENRVSDKHFEDNINQLNIFERQLSNDGYVIVKLFLHTQNSQKNKDYENFVSKAIQKTSTKDCPWYILNGENKDICTINAYHTIINAINKNTISNDNLIKQENTENFHYNFQITNVHKLSEIKHEYILYKKQYKNELSKQQKKFECYVKKLKEKNISLILAFEGWDASGKGGNIKRIIKPLNPLDYKVVPIPAPTQEELSKHYLWRFYNSIGQKGQVTIFDRTWYGRVLVEKIEKLTPENRCMQAYRELNEFEKFLYDNKTIIVKFWLHIDKQEQLKRFKSRQQDENRRWKICEEDWRNREKWDQYEKCANEMIAKTSTDFAPWNLIGSNNKMSSRIKCLKIINKHIKNYLSNEDNKKSS